MPRDKTGKREPDQKQKEEQRENPRKTQNTKTHKTYKIGKKDERSKGRERFFKNISKKEAQRDKRQRPRDPQRQKERERAVVKDRTKTHFSSQQRQEIFTHFVSSLL